MNLARIADNILGAAPPPRPSAFDRISASLGRPRLTIAEQRRYLITAANGAAYATDKGPDKAVVLTRKLGMIPAVALVFGLALASVPARAQTSASATLTATAVTHVLTQFNPTAANPYQHRQWLYFITLGSVTAWCSYTDPAPAPLKPGSFPVPTNTPREYAAPGFVPQSDMWCVAENTGAQTTPFTVITAP